MKKIIFSLAMFAFLVSGSVCMAQNRPQRMNPGQRTEKMVKDLGLDEKQAKDFKALMESMRPQRGQNMGERPSREEMQKRRAEMDAKIKGILTEEQYQKYQEMLKKNHRGKDGKMRRFDDIMIDARRYAEEFRFHHEAKKGIN